MKTISALLALGVSWAFMGSLTAAERERPPGERRGERPHQGERRGPGMGAAMGILRGLELSADQKAAVEKLEADFGPRQREVYQKMASILTPDQQKARMEAEKAAREAGKSPGEIQKAGEEAFRTTDEQKASMAEARKEMEKIQAEFREKVVSLLTPDQKAQIEKRMAPRGGVPDMFPGVELTAEQKEKLEALRKEMEPQMRAARQKMEGIFSEEQKKARMEAMKAAREAGKSGEELQKAIDEAVKASDAQKAQSAEAMKEMRELFRSMREKALELLTPAQKEQVAKPRGEQPRRERREEGRR